MLENKFKEESKEYPGFFHYPDDKSILVNREGLIRVDKCGKIIIPYLHTSGYMAFGKGSSRYRHHRVIARTFINKPIRHEETPYRELHVNHINGIKNDNRIENLEWVNNRENIIHAHVNNLHSKDKKTLAKRINKDEIMIFNSASNCAKFFSIHRATFWKHLLSGNSCKFQKDGWIFKLDDGKPWIKYPINEIKEFKQQTQRNLTFKIKNFMDNKTYIMDSYEYVAKFINVSKSKLFRSLKANGVFINNNHEVTILYVS
jgi:hypothetical protein